MRLTPAAAFELGGEMLELTLQQKESLCVLARAVIAQRLGVEGPSLKPDLSDDVFQKKCGAFVTIHLDENLRGCIGYITGVRGLAETVEEMAIAAAFRDPRFQPLRKDEYPGIDIEISVLTPLEDVSSIEDVVVGRDGLIISREFSQGLLLPQVAVEYGWNREQFLYHTCLKAGLPGDAWKSEGTSIKKFTAIVFGDKA